MSASRNIMLMIGVVMFLSLSATVYALPPAINASIINSTTNTSESDLFLSCYATDDENSSIMYSYVLYKNDTLNSSGINATISPTQYLFQETANVSETSTTINTSSLGKYVFNEAYLYVNYTIPAQYRTTGAIWQVKHGISYNASSDIAVALFYNVSVPQSCFEVSGNNLQLRFFSFVQTSAPSSSYGQCYNGTWNNITNISTITSNGYVYNSGAQQLNVFDGNYSTGSVGGSADFSFNWTKTCNPASGCLTSRFQSLPTAMAYATLYEESIYWVMSPSIVGYVNSGGLQKGQNWTLTCIANDTMGEIDVLNSSTFTIQNIAPNVSNVFVTNPGSYTNCTYDFSDGDFDNEVSSTYRWFKNGILLSPTLRTLSSGNYTNGDSLICEVRPNDGFDFGPQTNSSTFVSNDTLAPSINSVSIQSSGLITTPITISLNCTDANPLANGFPKAQWTNPNSIVEGNFSMTLNGGTGLYEKSYTYSIVGTYTNFTFYCADGSGNLNTTYSSINLVISASGTSTVTGGGGGGGLPDLPVASVVNFEVTPIAKQVNSYVGINNIEEFQIINKGEKDLAVNITARSALSDQIGFTFVDFTKTKQKNVNVVIPASTGLLSGTSYIRYSIIPPSGTIPGTYYVSFDVTSGSVTKTHTVTMKVQSNIFSPVVALWNKELFSTEVPCQDAFAEPAVTAGQVCEPLSVGLKAGTLFIILIVISFVIYVVVNVKKKRGAY